MRTPDRRVEQLLAQVSADDVRPAYLLCDRHPRDAVAFTVIESDLSGRDLTYAKLGARSEQMAAALASLGVGEGDRVATLMGKSEDLVVTLLGIWRLGRCTCPCSPRSLPPRSRLVCSRVKRRSWSVTTASEPSWTLARTFLPTPLGAWSSPAIRPLRAPETMCSMSCSILRTGGSPQPFVAVRPAGPSVHVGHDRDPEGGAGTRQGVGVVCDLHGVRIGCPGRGRLLERRRSRLGVWAVLRDPRSAGLPGIATCCCSRVSIVELTWNVLRAYNVTNLAAAPTVYRALRSDGPPAVEGLSLRVCLKRRRAAQP